MKKQITNRTRLAAKLETKLETLRVLAADDVERVRGGVNHTGCTYTTGPDNR